MAIVTWESAQIANGQGEQFEVRFQMDDVNLRLMAAEWDKNVSKNVFFQIKDENGDVVFEGEGAGNSGQQPITETIQLQADGFGWYSLPTGWTYTLTVITAPV